jgi:hypothetical protein
MRPLPLTHKYLVVGDLWDNWGYFSSYVENKTINYDTQDKRFEKSGCTREEVMEWLESPLVVAVVVNDHQDVFHDKIVSVPLGHHTSKVLVDSVLMHDVQVGTARGVLVVY